MAKKITKEAGHLTVTIDKVKFRNAHDARLFGQAVENVGLATEEITEAGIQLLTVRFPTNSAVRVPATLFEKVGEQVVPTVEAPEEAPEVIDDE